MPQLIVVGSALVVGRASETFGRRPVLILAFVALALRAGLFATLSEPAALLLVQVPEGVEAAIIGVLLPIMVADLTRNSGRYSLCLGLMGLAASVGAAGSTTLAGILADAYGRQSSLAALAAVAVAGLVLVLIALPETQVPRQGRPRLQDLAGA